MQAREIETMNERQRSHINYFLERLAHWGSIRNGSWTARMLAARDADERHPLRTEEEADAVLRYLSDPQTVPLSD